MTVSKILVVLTGLFLMAVQSSHAQIAELRIGAGEFSEDFINPGTEIDNGIEQSLALQGEIVFEEPEFLKWAFTPQPYISGTLNLEGNTNHAGVGLLWRQSLGKKFYGDFTFGAVIHDGTVNHDIRDYVDSENAVIDFQAYQTAQRTEREFGSRVLFREQLTLGYRFSESLSAEIFFEHLSNGLIIGRKPDSDNVFDRRDNDAVDTLGLRVSKRFD